MIVVNRSFSFIALRRVLEIPRDLMKGCGEGKRTSGVGYVVVMMKYLREIRSFSV